MFGRDRKLEERLRQAGQRAPAEVLEADRSRIGITTGNPAFAENTEVVWKLKLRVTPHGQPPFDAELKARFPQYGGPRAGTTVSILYDPSDRSRVILDSSAEGWADAALEAASGTGALADNPALAGSIEDLMKAALSDPTGFREHAREQAAKAFGDLAAAGITVPGTGTAPGSAAADQVDQLEKLADLRDRGVLSEEEFAEQKRRILGE